MLSLQKGLTNYLITVFLFLFVITFASNADYLNVTYAYSLYSGSESVAFSPDGRYIATGDTDGDVGFWEVGDDDVIDYVDLGGEVQGVAFSPDGRYLAADGDDGNVIVWLLDVATRTTVRSTYIHDDADNINSIAYSPDGRYVAVGVDLLWAYLWDLNSGERNGWGMTDASEVYDLVFSPDGRYLATGNDNGDLTLWELNSWWTDDVNTIDFKPGGNVQAVAFSPDGRYLAADGYDGSNTYVNIYNVSTRSVAWQINSGSVYAIAFSPNGEYIALGDNDGVITFYRIGTNLTHAAVITASDTVHDLAWSPDGTMVSDGRDVWNVNKSSAPIAERIGNKIYWVDFFDGEILRSNLDGSGVEVVLSGLGSPKGIAVDATDGKLYWSEEGTDKIQCANLDGSNVQELINIKDVRSPTSIALDVDAGKMYWIQTFVTSSEIWRANLNGSNPQRILGTSLDSLNGIALDTAGGKIYWTQLGFLASNKIRRANLDGSNVQTLVTSWGAPSGIALDDNADKMYWTDSREHKIQRANLDGSNVQTLVASGLDAPVDITLDVAGGKMYWTERLGGKIRRADFDGSNVQTLVSGLSRPYGIALKSTAEVMPVTPQKATVKLSPVSVESPEIGEQLTFSLNIVDGENVAGYQATVQFDTTALKYVQSANGDYLPDGAFFIPPVVQGNTVQLAASSLAGETMGDGTLATVTFEIIAVKDSTLTLSDVLLTNNTGQTTEPLVEAAQITESSLLSNNIGLKVPPDLISEVAFGPNLTYFVLNAQFPTLTGVESTDVIYGDCTITLDLEGVPDNSLSDRFLPNLLEYLRQAAKRVLPTDPVLFMAKEFAINSGILDVFPDEPQYFIFPLLTATEKAREVEQESDTNLITALVSTLVGLIPVKGDALSAVITFGSIEYKRVLAIDEILRSTMDPVIRLTNSTNDPGRPNDVDKYVLILPKRVKEIKVKVEQVYMLESDKGELHTAPPYEGMYNLETNVFSAPSKQLLKVSDYPPFQLLSRKVQDFLRNHFSNHINAVGWHYPHETSLLPNYPNPFNPETWIPYQLAAPADVTLTIYAIDGTVVRTLALGHQPAGIYQARSHAAHWDGKNAQGEPVASGVYFYTLSAGEFSATRKMLIRK